MTREHFVEKENELLLRRYNKNAKIKLKTSDITIPEDIVDILAQKAKRTTEQEKKLQQFRKMALEKLRSIECQIKEERLEKARKTREANLQKDPRYVKHFGVWVNKELPSAKISREYYAQINPRSSVISVFDAKYIFKKDHLIIDEENRAVFYTDEFCNAHREKCLKNFDINMHKFSLLNPEMFNAFLEKYARNRKFQQVFSFEEPLCNDSIWENADIVGLVYIMVLDKYRQAYIGITYKTIEERIKEHWRHKRAFDRLLWGSQEESVLSIDSFGPLDTTRLYVKPYYSKFKTPLERYEYKCIKEFDSRYLLNRMR